MFKNLARPTGTLIMGSLNTVGLPGLTPVDRAGLRLRSAEENAQSSALIDLIEPRPAAAGVSHAPPGQKEGDEREPNCGSRHRDRQAQDHAKDDQDRTDDAPAPLNDIRDRPAGSGSRFRNPDQMDVQTGR